MITCFHATFARFDAYKYEYYEDNPTLTNSKLFKADLINSRKSLERIIEKKKKKKLECGIGAPAAVARSEFTHHAVADVAGPVPRTQHLVGVVAVRLTAHRVRQQLGA